MKALLLTAMILCGVGSVAAQKKSTLLGEVVIGELTRIDEVSREVTVKYPGKEGTEIFSGILGEGYKLKTADGGPRDLKLNEILPGMHIRVFYKADHEKVSGQEKKVNRIFRVDYLGKDEYVRLRNQLNVSPSTNVAHAEKDDLPAVAPLKVYLAIPYNDVHQDLVDWINKWNRKNSDSNGKLELVSDLQQADILIVVARGSDTMVAVFPMEAFSGSVTIKGEWSEATSYVVVKDPGGLKVLWTSVAPVFSSPKVEVSSKTTELVIAEMEKRMKARVRNTKK